MTVHRSVSPWALAGLLGVSVAIALFGWYQVRCYEKAQSRFEAFEARIESELPHPGVGSGSSATPGDAFSPAAEPASVPATPVGELDVVITSSPAAEEGDGEAVSSTTIQVGKRYWTLSRTSDDTLNEIEAHVRSVVEEHGITAGTIHMDMAGSSLNPVRSMGIVLRVCDLFGRAGAKLDVVFEVPMPPAFEPAK